MLHSTAGVNGSALEPLRVSKPRWQINGGWNVTRFLFCGGTMLVILGFTGIMGWLGLISRANLFNPPNWIHWIHLGFGLFVLLVAEMAHRRFQIRLALLGAVAGTTLGVGGLASVLFAHLRNSSQLLDISDPLAHLTVGMLAIWALRSARSRSSI